MEFAPQHRLILSNYEPALIQHGWARIQEQAIGTSVDWLNLSLFSW